MEDRKFTKQLNEIRISLSEYCTYGPYLNMSNTQEKFWSNKWLASWVIDIHSYKLPGHTSINTVTMRRELKKLKFNSNNIYLPGRYSHCYLSHLVGQIIEQHHTIKLQRQD